MTRPRVAAACVCLAGLLIGGGAAARPAARPKPLARPNPRPVVALGVHESEYKIRLTRQSLRHGRVVVELRNLGEDPHDLVVRPTVGSGPTFAFGVGAPGSRRRKVLTVRPGRWLLYCSLPGHEQLGMKAILVVR